MAKIPTANLEVQKKLFHNEWVDVYPTTLDIDQITFWRQNNRTIFTFERLCDKIGKSLESIHLDDITRYVASQDIHKIQVLADSIGRNGVQVPMVIKDDGKLLDGNRRFFACRWLKMQCEERNKAIPKTLSQIPVHLIKSDDLTETLELKILAEANFIPDLKVAWPLDAQARAVEQYFSQIIDEKNLDRDSALTEVVAVFGIQRQRAIDLLDTLSLTKEFIDAAKSSEDKIRRRGIVEEKFVYLWEFRNKAMKGKNALDQKKEIEDVKDLFFLMMAKGRDSPITNVKQIEPMVQAKRDETAWSMLKESKGEKIRVVVSMMNDKKEIRKDEDKIRVFLSFLKGTENLRPKALTLLGDVVELARKKFEI